MQMYEEQEQVLQQLTLPMILSRDDLCLQQIFSLKDIQSKIKRQMKIFIEYCRGNQTFTDRLISLGLKCPMHQSNNPQMKNVAYIAADILTSDHEAVADLLIHAPNNNSQDSEEDGEIAEEIQTEASDNHTHAQVQEVDKYKYLSKIVEYIQGENLQENCLNYITKCLQILVRKKLNAFLEYFHQNPQVLVRLAQLSHFPSVARLLGKLITDDEDNMSSNATETRKRILPLLLEKIRGEVEKASTSEVFESLQDILQSSRYGDMDFDLRSQLQCLTDAAVSEEEVTFHLENLLLSLQSVNAQSLSSVFNSSTFLSLIVTRMNMDQQHDYSDEPQPFKPTLKYRLDKLFHSFCKLVQAVGQIQLFREINPGVFKLVIVKQFQLLSLLAKHSRFGGFYAVIPKEQRLNAVKFLISGIARRRFSGILLQLASSLVEKIVLQEERIAESHPEGFNKVSPGEMFQIISDHQLHLSETVHELAHEGTRQRNRNQEGIYLRKLLVLFDNFFKNTEIHKHFPEIQTITKLFPSFSLDKCKKYADITAISNHPGGARAKTPEEFKFMQRNKDFMKTLIVDQLETNPAQPVVESPAKQKEVKMLFKLNDRIQTLKDKVKDKQIAKEESNDAGEKSMESPNQKEKKEAQVDSPTRHNSPQPCLLFFIRHLTIY